MTQTRRRFLQSAGKAGLFAAGLSHVASRLGAADAEPLFEEVPPAASGIHWIHDNAISPQRFLPESLGPGCAFLDYDNDGWVDIYLVNSGPSDFYRPARPLKNALYKNNRDGTFTDVTDRAGVAGGTFGMGVAVGDYDNDGYPDLFVTGYGRSILFHNNRDGTFTDVTTRAGVEMSGWTTGAVWFDYDGDGRLDLFVCSFVQYGLDRGLLCADRKDGRLYYHTCIPHLFKPTPNVLWHNNGDGTFTQVRGTDIDRSPGKGLGVVATDVNNDGRMDLFVANDTVQNFLFVNQGAGRNRFQERGLLAGVGFSASGEVRSGMGVDAADFDGDGWQDLFVANIDHEMFSLYQNTGGSVFSDVARAHGIADATRLLSGWGLKFFDFDNDGRVDLILANGHPDDTISLRAAEVKYKEPLLLFRHDGRRFRNISQQGGPVFAKPLAARGLAVGDFDNDGRVDVLVGCSGDAPVLLHNRAGRDNHWCGLKLQGVTCNRDAIGARITWSAGGVRRSQLKNGGGSYLSSHDPRAVLGLGHAAKLDWVEIAWPQPSGKIERITDVPVDRYMTVTEGRGIT